MVDTQLLAVTQNKTMMYAVHESPLSTLNVSTMTSSQLLCLKYLLGSSSFWLLLK